MVVRRIKSESGAIFEIEIHVPAPSLLLAMTKQARAPRLSNLRRFLICAPHLHSSLLTPNFSENASYRLTPLSPHMQERDAGYPASLFQLHRIYRIAFSFISYLMP